MINFLEQFWILETCLVEKEQKRLNTSGFGDV